MLIGHLNRFCSNTTASLRLIDERLMQNSPSFHISCKNSTLKPSSIFSWTDKPWRCAKKANSVCSTAVAHTSAKTVSRALTNQVLDILLFITYGSSRCSNDTIAFSQLFLKQNASLKACLHGASFSSYLSRFCGFLMFCAFFMINNLSIDL